jgi:hypothetical protein
MSVRRTNEWIQREYGSEKWPEVERLIEHEIASEPDITLSRALERVARQFEWKASTPLKLEDCVIGDAAVRMPRSAAFGAARGLIADTLHHHTRPDTRLVVELGSGWGWHLLTFWLSGGPRDAEYVAAEYTQAGRRAATRLAGLDSQLRFRAVEFDYHEPTVPSVDEAHAIVYTQHSVEQIPAIKPEVIAAMAAAAPSVTGIHFEPVGWQIRESEAGSSREYAERHDYNRNLVEVLRDAERDGIIEILEEAIEVVGVIAPNTSTIIIWTRAGRSAA